MSIFKKLLITLGFGISLTFLSVPFAYSDGPVTTHEDDRNTEWAPKFKLTLHPQYLEFVLLEKLYETADKAYYKTHVTVLPPKDTLCTDYPDTCVLDRPDAEE